MSVLQGLRRACQINPQGVATVDGALQAAGVGRGDRVAILSLNRAAYLEYFYAAPWAGVTVVPLNTRLAAPELVAIREIGDGDRPADAAPFIRAALMILGLFEVRKQVIEAPAGDAPSRLAQTIDRGGHLCFAFASLCPSR